MSQEPQNPASATSEPASTAPGTAEERPWFGRTAALIAAVALVLCTVSVFAYREGRRTLEKRAEQKLELVGTSVLERVHSAIIERISVLHVLARQELMLGMRDGDADQHVHEALHNTRAQSAMFKDVMAIDTDQSIVATTRSSGVGDKHPLSESTRALLLRHDDALVRRTDSGELEILVPIVYSRRGDPVHLGYLRSTGSMASLLPEETSASIALLDADRETLAERRLERAVPEGTATGRRTLDLPLNFPASAQHDDWILEVSSDDADLEIEARVLLRTTVLLALGTAVALGALLISFTRIEAGLFQKLSARATELATLNQRLDRSRADLVKAARVAGMSEIAVGVLHNAGNALNSVNVAARQCQTLLARSSHKDLTQLVEHLHSEAEGLRAALLEHPRGEAFLEYLTEITHRITAHADQLGAELRFVNLGMSEVAALLGSQQSFASGQNVVEECDADDVLEGALLVSHQVQPGEEIEVEKRNLAPGRVQLCRHRAIGILAALINNARQSVREAEVAPGKISLEVAPVGNKLQFRVTDNGVGIAPEHLTEIFHHGFTTREDANGFGLHAAINAARELGGGLRAESEGEGMGATFVLDLPFERIAERAA